MKRLIVLVAIIATLALPVSAFAATSQGSAETLVVNATMSVSGLPTTLNYGANDAGAMATAGVINLNVTTNDPTGVTLSASGGVLTSPDGTIAASARAVKIDGVVQGSKHYAGAASPAVEPRVDIPSGAPAGTYTGTFTVSVAP